jgi:hypothetical protein
MRPLTRPEPLNPASQPKWGQSHLMSGDSVVGLISILEAILPLGIDLEHGAEVGLLYLFMPLFVESHQ